MEGPAVSFPSTSSHTPSYDPPPGFSGGPDEKRMRIGRVSIGPNVLPWKASRQAQRRMGVSGTRTPVSAVFENLQDMNVDELVEEFGVTREQVRAVLEFAAHSAEAPAPRL